MYHAHCSVFAAPRGWGGGWGGGEGNYTYDVILPTFAREGFPQQAPSLGEHGEPNSSLILLRCSSSCLCTPGLVQPAFIRDYHVDPNSSLIFL